MNHLLSAMDFNWILTGLSEELLQVGLLVCRKSSQAGAHALARVDALAVAIEVAVSCHVPPMLALATIPLKHRLSV